MNCNINLAFTSSEPFDVVSGRTAKGISFVASLSNHERLTRIKCYSPLDPRVPLVALIFPVAALALLDAFIVSDEFDGPNIFGVFVTELVFETQAEGGAVFDGKSGIVHFISQDGLRVVRIP